MKKAHTHDVEIVASIREQPLSDVVDITHNKLIFQALIFVATSFDRLYNKIKTNDIQRYIIN